MILLFQGTPIGALTGIADPMTQETIKKVLNLAQDANIIYVSPNSSNLQCSVKKVKKELQLRSSTGLTTW